MTDKMAAELEFMEWLSGEMPAGTVIADPQWWAGRILRRLRQALSAPRVPDGFRSEIEEVRDLIAGAPIDSLGTAHSEYCAPWPIRDEVVDRLTAMLAASPEPVAIERDSGTLTVDADGGVSKIEPKRYEETESGHMPIFRITKDDEIDMLRAEVEALRERVKVLEGCFHKMIGVPASAGVCEPIEGYVKRPHDAVDAMRKMAARLREGGE